VPVAMVVDYGVGNLFSMSNALRKTGFHVDVIEEPQGLQDADALVLPGVGNFGAAAANLEPFRKALRDRIDEGTPLLGSCLGMQLLFERSEESPGEGLGILFGEVKRFVGGMKTPHMGWNTVTPKRGSLLLDGIKSGSYFYFVHSYYPKPADPRDTLATTNYGVEFASIVERGNVYGAQFHPEKSGEAGARLLTNFAELVKR
jgi:imidazole glycerol phosphate synthase glutamine amidotransferase subunit